MSLYPEVTLRSIVMRQLIRLLVLGTIIVNLMYPGGAAAQTNSRFFPETGRTVGGRFLDYWQSNGGLPVFGYPLSDQIQENGRSVQYFERQRFELHPENARPYDVLLGRLGAELLARSGGNPPIGSGTPAGCVRFDLTQHTVCNQSGTTGFLSYWRSHGLEFDRQPGKSYAESLALFGYPLSEAYDYVASNGETISAQWFERARFEWHPNNPQPYKVLLGRLGAEIQSAAPNPPLVNQVLIFMVAVDDDGRSGKRIGCNDSIIPITLQIEPTPAPLRAALTQLFAVKSQNYRESGLYNALYQSDLRIDSLSIVDARATVNLIGTLRLNGACDAPRVQAQIEETVRQFATVGSADIFVNGTRLSDALSQR
jgi:hypothetical protein